MKDKTDSENLMLARKDDTDEIKDIELLVGNKDD